MQILQINPKLKKYTGSNEKSSIEIQLQNAHLEIKMLRDENKVLSIRIAQLVHLHLMLRRKSRKYFA